SRRYERVADRYSLELTHDLAAFEEAHRSLARKNLSDLDPPRLAYLLVFTHPTPPERLAYGRAAAAPLPGNLGAEGNARAPAPLAHRSQAFHRHRARAHPGADRGRDRRGSRRRLARAPRRCGPPAHRRCGARRRARRLASRRTARQGALDVRLRPR